MVEGSNESNDSKGSNDSDGNDEGNSNENDLSGGNTMTCARTLIPVALLCLLALSAQADVTLNGMFTDNMVLQRGIELPIWGFADAGEEVIVSACGQTRTATADADGKWMVRLDPIEMEGAFAVTISGNNEIVLRNVVMGEVWICSGQSNMAWTVARSLDAEDEIAGADYPLIRLCQVPRATATEPADHVETTWVECSPGSVGNFGAVGYFFGRELHEELAVPVGLISTNWGGTPAEAWTSREKMEGDPDYAGMYEWWEAALEAYPERLEKYQNETLPAWQKQVEEAKAAGETPPRRPRAPAGPDYYRRPSNLFNGMIAPLIPYAIRGAIWYQGEANANAGGGAHTGAWHHRRLLPTMIEDWRERWGQGDFPFAWVSLANFRAVQEQPGPSAWAELRESQTLTLSLPNTGEALAIDVGEADDIHPRDKQTVGHRLALWARAEVYGQDLVHTGPTYESMRIEGDRVRLQFANVADGLRRGVTENAPYPSPLLGFQIAGKDRRWVWADAAIRDDSVVVWSDEVADPVAVRYGWADNPAVNLYNSEGLPAVPFRTDDWPLTTEPRD